MILSKWCPLKLHFNTQTIPSCSGRLAPAGSVSQHFPYSTINIHEALFLLPQDGAGFIFMNSSQLGLASFTYYPTPELWFCSAVVSIFFIFSDIWDVWRECEVWKKLLIPGSWPKEYTKSIFKIQYLIQTLHPDQCETTVFLSYQIS